VRDRKAQEESLRYIDAHLGRLPVVVLARWGRAFSLFHPSIDLNASVVLGTPRVVAWTNLVMFYGLAALSIAGAVILRRRRIPIFPLVAFVVIVLVGVATTFGQARYRASAEPAIVLLAAVAIERLARLRRADPPAALASQPRPGAGSTGS
jgi:hypothetical protein